MIVPTMRCSDSKGLGKPGEEFRFYSRNGRPQAEGAGLHPSPLLPGMASRLQSSRPVGRVAELGSLGPYDRP